MVLAIDRKNYRCRIQPFAEGQLRRGQPQPLQAAAVGLPPSLPNIALQTSIVRPIVSFNRDRKTRRTGDDMRNSGVRSWCQFPFDGSVRHGGDSSRGHLPPGGKRSHRASRPLPRQRIACDPLPGGPLCDAARRFRFRRLAFRRFFQQQTGLSHLSGDLAMSLDRSTVRRDCVVFAAVLLALTTAALAQGGEGEQTAKAPTRRRLPGGGK